MPGTHGAFYYFRLRCSYLTRGGASFPFLKVYDSPSLPESECAFSLGPAGIEDAKDA